MAFTSITALCRSRLQSHLQPGDWALDATAGNGHDTLTLAEAVGASGRVFSIDLQEEALAHTAARLEAAGLSRRVKLLPGDHAALDALLPREARGRLRAIVFNLGYLPGGDKTLTTKGDTTLPALELARDWLAPDGLLAIVCYPGHPEGAREAAAVETWALAQQARFVVELVRPGPRHRPPPFLVALSPRTDLRTPA